ncbi:MAG TPA: ABC transporter permease [bacterium]|nr:ABC transporter permease [bacterium]HPQ65790.1 ABC transporter permease [bacterium]
MSAIEAVGSGILRMLEGLGQTLFMLGRGLGWSRQAWRYRALIVEQMLFCGVESLPVVAVVAFFAGMITSLQTGTALADFQLEESIGTIVAVSVCREMGPVFAAIIVAARVGSALAAQLGTMKVSEEIDALEAMSIDPVKYLVMPRLVGLILMMPILAMFSDVIGISGGAIVGRLQIGVPYSTFFDRAVKSLVMKDILVGILKTTVFGIIIGSVACQQGLTTQAGALGVGRSTTRTVVVSLMFVLMFNYFISALFY